MKLRSPDRRRGIFSARAVFALAAAVFIPLLVYGSAPSWWSERGILIQGASANDFAPANQGQLKNIAKAAMAEMDAKLPGGAGQSVHDLVGSWSNPATQPNDFAPVNLGQLKTVAKPFYDRLIAASLITQYPWIGAANQPSDFAIANIGQVKQLFSFVFVSISTDLPLSPRLVAGGTNHTVAVYSDGTVWTWGDNSNGQLGDGTTTTRWHREQVPGLSNIVAVSAHGDTSLALRSDGIVWAWGANDEGGVANGTFDDTSTPSQVMVDETTLLQGVIAIAAGESHNLALTSDGTVWAWGADWGYQLADDLETDRPFARQVLLDDGTPLNNVASIGCGNDHNLVVRNDGTVWTWGYNGEGELGTGGSDWRYGTPTQVPNLGNVISATGGETLSVALKQDGTVWSWGHNFAGQLGNTSSGATPTIVGGIDHITQIACGAANTLALKADGTVWAWGWNNKGQLGIDPRLDSAGSPVQNKQISGIVAVAAGKSQGFAISADGALIGWGSNSYGALGRPISYLAAAAQPVWDFRLRDDPDHDGLSSSQELLLGGDPQQYSTAQDGISDGWKASYGFSLTDLTLASRDLIGNGTTVLQSFQSGVDPFTGREIDPAQYHDGTTVFITMLTGPPTPFLLDQSYRVMIAEAKTAQGVLARDVPITFTVTQGAGTLVTQPTANPPVVTTLTLRTGADGRATAYFMPTGVGNNSQATITPPTGGSVTGPSNVGGKVLDPNGDDDGDGKSNKDELDLGTDPSVFNLFSETHYSGHPESPHSNSDPLPWTFYSETLAETPSEWSGLDVSAHIVFDSGGTANNWVVDDYASVNDSEFVRLGHDLIYDVTGQWDDTGSNTFSATSDITGGIFCAAFKLVLSVELSAEFQAQDGEINSGFDPRGTDGGTAHDPWASVMKGGISDVVKLVVPHNADRAKLFVMADSGPLEIDVDQKEGFVDGDNTLQLIGNSGTDSVTTATIEVHLMDEDGDDTGMVLAKLHVMALPHRTIPIGIYPVGDSRLNPAGTGPRAVPPGVPSTSDIETQLNERLGQCGLSFTISTDSRPLPNIAFDEDSDGAVDGGELSALDDVPDTLNSRLCVLLVEKSGETTDPHGFPRGTGTSDEQHKGCLIFVQNSGGYAASIATHEVGHLLNLSMYGPDEDPPGLWNLKKHDPGPFPAGTEGLMQKGTGSNHPGSWLGHEDWRAANETAKGLGF